MLRNQRRRNIQKKRQPITYQNKDVVSKLFAEKMRNRSFSAYGLMLPEIIEVLPTKFESGEVLTEEEQMQFVILPLIYKNIEKKQDCICRCVELGKKIKFPEMQAFLLSGLLVFTDKVIRKDDSEEIRRYLGMTKIGKIIQEEIQQAVDEAVARTERETRKETRRETRRETRKKTSLDIAK